MATLQANIEHYRFEIEGLSESLRLTQYEVNESLSETFLCKLHLASENSDIDFASVVGKIGVLSIYDQDLNEVRYVHGVVKQFDQVGQRKRFTLYYLELVPQLYLLNYRRHNRVFQQLSVEDIILSVIKDANLPLDYCNITLSASYEPRNYCVQYGETDINFIQRLMEEEGMFYYFEHTEDSHTLRIADHLSVHTDIVNPDLIFNESSNLVADKNYVYALRYSQAIQSGSVRLSDFNFEKPELKLQVDAEAASDPHLNLYDYPGVYDLPERGKTLATVLLEAEQAKKTRITGRSNCRQLLPGYLFSVKKHPRHDFNQAYMVTALKQAATQPQVLEEAGADTKTTYESDFTCIPKGIAYRPPRRSTKPRIDGVQTAIVVGPPGEEIYTDEYGRVKVQFHWDLAGKMDENTSCWIRVSQAWAGEGWGSVFIPRIGQEVVVDFVNGDPDRPLITGRVYHGVNRSPYNLPGNKTQSGVKTRSSPGGGVANYNELRFEDLKSNEEVYLQAEKDWNILVKNDKGQDVGRDERLEVKHDRNKKVGNDQSEHIVGNKSIQVDKNHVEKIKKNMDMDVDENQSIRVKKDKAESVGKNSGLDVGENYTVQVGKQTVIDSGKEIVIRCGKSSIVMQKNGDVQIVGANLNVKMSGNIKMKGAKIAEN